MKKIKDFFSKLGPGFITGASDDDPSGIATYAQTGALFGYMQLWTALFTFPFMTVIQEICGRIGMVTGNGLAGVIRKHYSRTVLYFAVTLLFLANTINIGADLGAMASAGQLLIGIPFIVWLFGMTLATILLVVVVSYKTYAKVLKYLALSLFAYVVTAFIVKQDWNAIAWATLVPSISFSKVYLMNIVAILGTTISPYLFFWQADEEVEEEIAHHKLQMMGKGVPKVTKKDIREMRLDTIIGMFFSNVVMFFIIVTTASTLSVNGVTSIGTATEAAEALRPLAGDFAFLLFASGIIGTGFLAVPILAGSAAYALSESLGWKAGLYQKFSKAHGFYGTIIIALLIGILVNFTPIEPFQMLYYTAVLNGIIAPILLILIMRIGSNKEIMGNNTTPLVSQILGWLITGVMSLAVILLIGSFWW